VPLREWKPGSGDWAVGERATWAGVVLVCCRRHYAGERALHPWDPAHGWSAAGAATLWAPDGDVEEAKLVAAVRRGVDGMRGDPHDRRGNRREADRLEELMCHVTRRWTAEAA
jgi:hypothetical protein